MLYLDQEDIRILKKIVALHKQSHLQFVNVTRRGGLLDWASAVCNFYGIELESFYSRKRDRDLVYARRDFVHLVTKHTPHTTAIAKFMKKDHTSVIYHKRHKPIHMHKIKLAVKNLEVWVEYL